MNEAPRPELPIISPGALRLLSVALEKDRDKRLTSNAALRAALELLAQLPQTCRSGSRRAHEQLGFPDEAPNLFRFCAMLLTRVETTLERRDDDGRSRWNRSEYDHPVLLALAQTIARVAGMSNALGPDIRVVMRRLGEQSPESLQRALVENYLGNVLQDYFDACEVRYNVPDLHQDAEIQLRKSDARSMAEWVFDPLSLGRPGQVQFEAIERRLAQLMAGLFVEDTKRKRGAVSRGKPDARPRGRERGL